MRFQVKFGKDDQCATKNLGSEPPPSRGTFKIYRASFADPFLFL